MRYHVLAGVLSAGAMTALAFVGSTAAQAQVYVAEPGVGPAYVAPTAPVVVAPAPTYIVPSTTYVAPGYGYAYDYGYAPQPYVAAPVVSEEGYTTVNSFTGRRCTVKPDGYRWCWTP